MTDLRKLGYRARILAIIVVAGGLISAGFAIAGSSSVPLAYLALCGMLSVLLGIIGRTTQHENQKYLRRKLDMIRTDQKAHRSQIAVVREALIAQTMERQSESHRLLGRIDYIGRRFDLQALKLVALRESLEAICDLDRPENVGVSHRGQNPQGAAREQQPLTEGRKPPAPSRGI